MHRHGYPTGLWWGSTDAGPGHIKSWESASHTPNADVRNYYKHFTYPHTHTNIHRNTMQPISSSHLHLHRWQILPSSSMSACLHKQINAKRTWIMWQDKLFHSVFFPLPQLYEFTLWLSVICPSASNPAKPILSAAPQVSLVSFHNGVSYHVELMPGLFLQLFHLLPSSHCASVLSFPLYTSGIFQLLRWDVTQLNVSPSCPTLSPGIGGGVLAVTPPSGHPLSPLSTAHLIPAVPR